MAAYFVGAIRFGTVGSDWRDVQWGIEESFSRPIRLSDSCLDSNHTRYTPVACQRRVCDSIDDPFGDSIDEQKGSYLVDPASSHMLVSKIKPCMSKYKLLIL